MDIWFGLTILGMVGCWLVFMGWFEMREARRRTKMIIRVTGDLFELTARVYDLEWRETMRQLKTEVPWPHEATATGEVPVVRPAGPAGTAQI